jgi:hypothetical protein
MIGRALRYQVEFGQVIELSLNFLKLEVRRAFGLQLLNGRGDLLVQQLKNCNETFSQN